jgi:rhomboid protease GluP
VVNPKTRIPAGIAATHRNSAAIFIAYNLFNGFVNPGIDNAAHIGGLVGGVAMGWSLGRPVNLEARQEPLGRLAIGTLGGAALLLALAWPLFHR